MLTVLDCEDCQCEDYYHWDGTKAEELVWELELNCPLEVLRLKRATFSSQQIADMIQSISSTLVELATDALDAQGIMEIATCCHQWQRLRLTVHDSDDSPAFLQICLANAHSLIELAVSGDPEAYDACFLEPLVVRAIAQSCVHLQHVGLSNVIEEMSLDLIQYFISCCKHLENLTMCSLRLCFEVVNGVRKMAVSEDALSLESAHMHLTTRDLLRLFATIDVPVFKLTVHVLTHADQLMLLGQRSVFIWEKHIFVQHKMSLILRLMHSSLSVPIWKFSIWLVALACLLVWLPLQCIASECPH